MAMNDVDNSYERVDDFTMAVMITTTIMSKDTFSKHSVLNIPAWFMLFY